MLLLLLAAIFTLTPLRSSAEPLKAYAVKFDGVSSTGGNQTFPLSVVLSLMAEQKPGGVLAVYAAEISFMDGSLEATRLFSAMNLYALSKDKVPALLNIKPGSKGTSGISLVMDRLSSSTATRWDIVVKDGVATFDSKVGDERHTFVGKLVAYNPPVEGGTRIATRDILIFGGLLAAVLITLFIIRERLLAKQALEQLKAVSMGGYDDYLQLPIDDEDEFFVAPKHTPETLHGYESLSIGQKLLHIGLRLGLIGLTLVLLRVDGPWLFNEARDAVDRPISLIMDLPRGYWMSASVAAPWQILSFAALVSSVFTCLLMPPRLQDKVTFKTWFGFVLGAIILILGTVGHAPTVTFSALTFVLVLTARSSGHLHGKRLFPISLVMVLLCIPLPESLLASWHGMLKVSASPATIKLLLIAEATLGVVLGVLMGIASMRRVYKPRVKANINDIVLIAAIPLMAIVVGIATAQAKQVRAQASWIPAPPLAIAGYLATEQPFGTRYSEMIGNPKGSVYVYQLANAPEVALTIVSGAHLDAYHDPTVSMAQGDFTFAGQIPSKGNAKVRRMLFRSASAPQSRIIMDYWEQEQSGHIETMSKMGRVRNLPSRILKGVRQVMGGSPTVIVRLHAACTSDKACKAIEEKLDTFSGNIQQNLK